MLHLTTLGNIIILVLIKLNIYTYSELTRSNFCFAVYPTFFDEYNIYKSTTYELPPG